MKPLVGIKAKVLQHDLCDSSLLVYRTVRVCAIRWQCHAAMNSGEDFCLKLHFHLHVYIPFMGVSLAQSRIADFPMHTSKCLAQSVDHMPRSLFTGAMSTKIP